jgi:hypothetical protein
MNYLSKPLHGVRLTPWSSELSCTRSKYRVGLSHSTFSVPNNKPIWRLLDEGKRYKTEVNLHASGDDLILHIDCEGQGQFKLNEDNIEINWTEQGTSYEHYLQTMGMALWLDTFKQVPCIHGNAISYGELSFGLVAPSRTGKTTLTAALCQQGAELMSDDMMALHPCRNAAGEPYYDVYSSWPIARMWPDAINAALNTDETQFSKVHDKFSKRLLNAEQDLQYNADKREVNAIYILNRIEVPEKSTLAHPTCWIETVNPSKALIILIQNSMLADAYSALGIEEARLARLIDVVQTIPIKQVNYYSGIKQLPNVCQTILQDIQTHKQINIIS